VPIAISFGHGQGHVPKRNWSYVFLGGNVMETPMRLRVTKNPNLSLVAQGGLQDAIKVAVESISKVLNVVSQKVP